MASVDLDQLTPTIEPMVMNTERGRTWMALFNAELGEITATEEATGSAMEVEESDAGASAPVKQRSRLERLRQEAAVRKESTTAAEPVIDVVMGSQTWHNEVPRVLLQFNSIHSKYLIIISKLKEWVPMIARDIQRQNRAPPPAAVPLSDAYLAGIPNKRRKLAEGSRPNTNPQLLLQGIIIIAQ